MGSKKAGIPKDSSVLSATASKVFDLVAALRFFFTEVRQNMREHLDRLLRRAEYLLVVYLWVSSGLLLLTLGVFYLLIDYAHVPRGIVFSTGGLVVFLTAVILLQSAKLHKLKR